MVIKYKMKIKYSNQGVLAHDITTQKTLT